MEEKIEKSFLDEYSDDFIDYIDRYRTTKWENLEEYRDLENKISNLKSKYPKVRLFLESDEIEELNIEELNVLKKILLIGNQIDVIEEKEIFKLGMKENYIFLENMDMINI